MPRTDVLQGTLDLLVLKTLSRGAAHGYAIANHIQGVSGDFLRVEEGSLYPALHRLERDGFVVSRWGTTDTGRKAKFYELTAVGTERLRAEEEQWSHLTMAVGKVLTFA
jgi:PadR family transcriptional regulator, regulatory protein PadR